MRVDYHVSARFDVLEIMEYYEAAAGAELASEFFAEFLYCVERISDQPTAFPATVKNLRRANLNRFPYNLLFRITEDYVRILVVRHNRRKPSFGIDRT